MRVQRAAHLEARNAAEERVARVVLMDARMISIALAVVVASSSLTPRVELGAEREALHAELPGAAPRAEGDFRPGRRNRPRSVRGPFLEGVPVLHALGRDLLRVRHRRLCRRDCERIDARLVEIDSEVQR